jgi:hypothetical protein
MGRVLYNGTSLSMNTMMNTLSNRPIRGIYMVVDQDANGAIIESRKLLL